MTYPSNPDLETPVEDAAEQATIVVPEPFDDDIDVGGVELSPETPEWDAREQHRTVTLDDDYR